MALVEAAIALVDCDTTDDLAWQLAEARLRYAATQYAHSPADARSDASCP